MLHAVQDDYATSLKYSFKGDTGRMCLLKLLYRFNISGDSYKSVLNNYNSKNQNIQTLKTRFEEIQKETRDKQAEVDKNNAELNVSRFI